MAQVSLTTDELVAALKNTDLPTVLVEGRDDMTVYRWIEEQLGIHKANVLACGGRDTLFSVFKRRDEFCHLKCAFVADRDMSLFDTKQSKCDLIIFTRGYSIENDILDSSKIHVLLSESEKAEFKTIATALALWFSFEIEEYRAGREYEVAVHPNQVVPLGCMTIDTTFLEKRKYRKPNRKLINCIEKNFTLRFRGKTLLELYVRCLSSPSRSSKFSKQNLLEIGTKMDSSVHLRRLIRLINRQVA